MEERRKDLQDTREMAITALNRAEALNARIASHEDRCAERYAAINEGMIMMNRGLSATNKLILIFSSSGLAMVLAALAALVFYLLTRQNH